MDSNALETPPILSFLHLVVGELSKRIRGQRAASPSAGEEHATRTSCGRTIAFVLTSLVRATRSPRSGTTATATSALPLTIFDDPDGIPPTISLLDYIYRMLLYTQAPREVFVVALVNLDRLLSRCPTIPLRATSVHRLFFAAFIVASKLHDDGWYSNRYYARVAGVETPELNAVEIAFIRGCEFHLQVSRETYDCYSLLLSELSELFSDDTTLSLLGEPQPSTTDDVVRYRKWLEFLVPCTAAATS